jgi:hypothetical protein
MRFIPIYMGIVEDVVELLVQYYPQIYLRPSIGMPYDF